MTDFPEIKQGVPLPSPPIWGEYGFRRMKVGDSIYTDRRCARSAASQFAKRNGWRFAVHKEGEGVRIWRKS